jgi:uncharacterized membrane protein YdjX (TVP38/TMEM64 family)
MSGSHPDAPALRGGSKSSPFRLVLVVALFAGFYGIGRWTGLLDELDTTAVRQMVIEAGVLGILVYVVIFALGELVHVPGIVFIGAGTLVYGPWGGFGVGLLGAIVSVSVSFFVVRFVAGNALARVERPFMRRMLARLDAQPIPTVAILRLVFWLAPPLNYALAMTNVRYRDYLAGSFIGLVLPILAMSLTFEWFV